MPVGFKYALPLFQMALADVLLRVSSSWNLATRTAGMRGMHPGFLLLLSINLPVALPFKSVYGDALPLWAEVVLIAAIGMFWYWIASRINSWQQRGTPPLFAWAPLRVTVDVLLIAAGFYLAWGIAEYVISIPAEILSPSYLGPYFVPVWASLLTWSVGLALVFGYDLVQCVRGNGRHTASALKQT